MLNYKGLAGKAALARKAVEKYIADRTKKQQGIGGADYEKNNDTGTAK